VKLLELLLFAYFNWFFGSCFSSFLSCQLQFLLLQLST
jgi:hypothetical protein